MKKKLTKINLDSLKRISFVKNYLKKQLFKSFIKDSTLSLEERNILYLKVTKYKSISITKLKNFCLINKSSKSVYKIIKLSRHEFKNKVLNGHLPG